MKRNVLVKDFFREIRGSFNRYLSILLIVALGVAFYAGVRSAEPDMKLSADALYDAQNMMDLRVNISLEEALDLGWKILAECFEPNETGLKTNLLRERWPKDLDPA